MATIKDLKQIAKQYNIRGYSRLRKNALVALLRERLSRRNHGQNHKPWRHSRNKKFVWWWHSWIESTTATTNRIYSYISNTTTEGKKIQRKTCKVGILVVTVCSRTCEKTNQQCFWRLQEKGFEFVSKTIKVWRKLKISFERFRKVKQNQSAKKSNLWSQDVFGSCQTKSSEKV